MSTSYAMEIESPRDGGTPRDARPFEEMPSDKGLPFVGSLFKYVRDPIGWMTRVYEQCGPVSRIHFASMNVVWLLGPEANRLLFLDRDELFSSFGGYDPLIGEIFPRGLMLRDFENHRTHRMVMQQAFRREHLERYLELMSPVIRAGVQAWRRTPGEATTKLSFLPTMKSLALDIATIVFMGDEPGRDADAVNRAFNDAVAGGGAIVRRAVPGLAYWKGLRGREFLLRYFGERVAWKRRNPDDSLFSRLCTAESDEGKRFSDDEIVDHMIFLMMAAHDTTTLTVTNAVYHLAKNPEWQERLLVEARAVGENPSYQDLLGAADTDRVFKEVLRMKTPVPGLPRKTTRDAVINGFHVPKGTICLTHMHFTHHLPSIWKDPERFDPDRFGPGREEHKAHKYAWAPFGGGAHMCIGLIFGELEAKMALLEIVRRYRLELPPNYTISYSNFSLPAPRDGLPITLRAR